MPKKSKLSPAVFEKAACKLQASRDDGTQWLYLWACNAIGRVKLGPKPPHVPDWCRKRDKLPEVKFFSAALYPTEADMCAYGLEHAATEDSGWFGKTHDERNSEARVLALLLCAELLRDGFTTEDFA